MQFLYRRQEPSGAVCRGWIICDKCFQDLSRIDQGIGFAVCLAISVIRPQHFRVLVTEYPVYVAGRIETSGNVYVLILIDRIEICSSLKIRHPVVNVLPRDVARSIFNRHGKAMGAIGMFFHHNLVEIQRRRRDPSFRIGLCRCPEDDGRHACLLLLGQGSTLWQQVAEKKSCEAKQKELTAQRDTLADRLKKLEKSKLAEQADVDRLEGHSLAAFFYQVIGKMDEKLDKERQEAYAARVKYDAALHDLSSVDADLEQIQNRLERLSDCERQYQAALSEKIKSIKASAHPAAQQVAESESRIAALKVQKRELLEAINAGKTALHTVNEVLETLDNAEGWSTWDVMGGGLMADLAKYEELDDAQKQIEQLQVELRRFKTELADVEITADLQVTVDSFLKFADFFFDGLFADWAVLDHINQAQSRVENTKGQIKRVLALLKKMREDVDVQIADEKEKQEQLAVETEL